MKHAEIIELAKQGGCATNQNMFGRTDYCVLTVGELKRFAELVAKAEKEACAQVFDADKFPDASTDYRIWHNEQMDMNAEKIRSRT